ncbi:MAG: hypothetical protein KatS3mg091_834 [Patescibacteria group bacterium]|nr:MAG: hypothetical protein KatS3mg091_834 [Patescibacteria group bacterium]
MTRRFYEILIPTITFNIILFPVWMSFFKPHWVAYFIIAFDLYFFYKSVTVAFYAVLSYKRIAYANTLDFPKLLQDKKLKHKASEILHLIVIPNYKEPLHILEKTLNKVLESDYPFKDKIYVVLAFEEREEAAREKYQLLEKKFSSNLRLLATYHKILPGEVVGKASNQSYAVKKVCEQFQKKQIDIAKVLVTVCDADSLLSKNYLSYLTYKFLNDSQRDFHFYWAPLLLYNNFEVLPFFVRLQATISSILRLAFLSQEDKLIQISTYSVNLKLLKNIGFWDTDIIPEDWHIYLQAFLKYGPRVKTVPVYTLLSGDAVYAGSVWNTFFNRYEQEKRWAWGVTDVIYFLENFWKSKVGFFDKLKKLIYVTETHLLWPTTFFIVTISANIPPLVNQHFAKTTFGFYLPKISAFILTMSTLFLIVYIYIDFKIRHKLNKKMKVSHIPFYFIQWYALPVISFLLSALPALEAHTRLFLNKKIEYKVTEKV